MTVLRDGAEFANMGWVMGVMTLAFMITMVGWVIWTWMPSRRALHEAAARLPLEED